MPVNFPNPISPPFDSLQLCVQAKDKTPLGRLACISAVVKKQEQMQTPPFEFQYDEIAFASGNIRGDGFSYLDAQFEMANSSSSSANSTLRTHASGNPTEGLATGATQSTVALNHNTNFDHSTSSTASYMVRESESPDKGRDSPQLLSPSSSTTNLLRPWDMLGERIHISKNRKKIQSLSHIERQIRYQVMQIKYGDRVPDITPQTPNIKDPLRDVHSAFLSSDGSCQVTAWATREDIRMKRALHRWS